MGDRHCKKRNYENLYEFDVSMVGKAWTVVDPKLLKEWNGES